MAVDAIQTNTNKKHQASYLKAGTIGALGGYASKYMLPLTQLEKDEKYLYDTFYLSASNAKEKAIESIINQEKLSPAQKEFAKLVNFVTLSSKKLKSYEEPLREQIIDLIKTVNKAGKDAKAITKRASMTLTKDIRPTGTFMALGAGIAIAGTFVHNVFNRMREKE